MDRHQHLRPIYRTGIYLLQFFFSSKVMDRKAMSVGIKKRLITSPTIFYSSSRSRIWAIQRPGEMNTRGTDKSSSYFIHSRTDVQSHDPFIDFFPPCPNKKGEIWNNLPDRLLGTGLLLQWLDSEGMLLPALSNSRFPGRLAKESALCSHTKKRKKRNV